jgi:hypothetical protein
LRQEAKLKSEFLFFFFFFFFFQNGFESTKLTQRNNTNLNVIYFESERRESDPTGSIQAIRGRRRRRRITGAGRAAIGHNQSALANNANTKGRRSTIVQSESEESVYQADLT